MRFSLVIAAALLAGLAVAARSDSARNRTETNGLIAFQSNLADPTDKQWAIYVMEGDGRNQRRLTHTGDDEEPAWSPDGKEIAFTSGRRGHAEIYVMDADGGNQRRLTHNRWPDRAPAWSPDDKQIAFQRGDCRPKCDIYVISADGGNQRRLTRTGKNHIRQIGNSSPAWSPDGKKIVFSSGRDNGIHLYVMNADGSDQRNLTPNRWLNYAPSWSPDGRKIVFATNRHGWDNRELEVMNRDGSDQRRFTHTPAWTDEPAWSPDGKKVAYYRQSLRAPFFGEIWVIDADGSRTKRLAFKGNSLNPSWQPLPRRS